MPDVEIEQFVRQRGFGEFLADTVVTYPGRNTNMAGSTTSGHDVFAKRVTAARRAGDGGAGAPLEDLARTRPWRYLRWPVVLAVDPGRGIHLTRWLKDSRTVAEAVTEQGLHRQPAHTLGAALGELHSAEFDRARVGRRPLPMPSVRVFSALSLTQYLESSGGLNEFWRTLQNDADLKRAVVELKHAEDEAAAVPIHADLRLDQILVTDEGLTVTDWEEFRYGDAARDIGTVVGEFLHRCVVEVAADDIAVDGVAGNGTDDEIVARGVRGLERALPALEAFTQGYRSVRSGRDRALAERAVGFAGWHLLDRVMAAAAYSAELSPVHRAAVGVGRTALARAGHFIGVLGLEAL